MDVFLTIIKDMWANLLDFETGWIFIPWSRVNFDCHHYRSCSTLFKRRRITKDLYKNRDAAAPRFLFY